MRHQQFGVRRLKHKTPHKQRICLNKSKISLVAYQEWLWSKKSNYFPLSVRLIKQSREQIWTHKYRSSFERHISNLLGFTRCRMSLTVMRKTSLLYTESKVFQTTSGVNHKDNTTNITHGEMDDTNQETQRNLWSAGRRHLEYKYTILTRAVDQFEILSRKLSRESHWRKRKEGKEERTKRKRRNRQRSTRWTTQNVANLNLTRRETEIT